MRAHGAVVVCWGNMGILYNYSAVSSRQIVNSDVYSLPLALYQ